MRQITLIFDRWASQRRFLLFVDAAVSVAEEKDRDREASGHHRRLFRTGGVGLKDALQLLMNR